MARHLRDGRVAPVLAGPGEVPVETLEAIGVDLGEAALAHESIYDVLGGGSEDRAPIVTDTFGTHPLMRDLAVHRDRVAVALPTAAALSPGAGAEVLLRAMPDTFEDGDGDWAAGPNEPTGPPLAVAVEGEGSTSGPLSEAR